MKKYFLIAVLITTSFITNAQAYETNIKHQKVEHPALAVSYNYTTDIIEKAVIARLDALKIKGKNSKGARVYSGVIIPEISSGEMNYTFLIDRKSKKEKNVSVIHLIMSGANVLNVSNEEVKQNAKTFLESFQPYIDAQNLELSIKEQEDLLSKAEKNLKNLLSDQSDLEKRIKKAESDLSTNRTEQSKQQSEIEGIKKAIELLKQKRG